MKFSDLIFRAMPGLALAGTLFLAQPAHAVLLLPGTGTPTSGDLLASIGSQYAPDMSYSVTFSNALLETTGTGTLVVGVYNDTLGGLDFVYQYTLDNCCIISGMNDGSLSALSASGFLGFTTDVGFDSTAAGGGATPSGLYSTGGTPATSINRSTSGKVVNFLWSPTITAPGSTEVLVVYVKEATSAAALGSVSMVDDTGTGPFLAYAPTPEPAYAGLLLGGLFGLGLLVTRRFQARQS